MKKIALLFVSLGLILSACSSPAPATTEAPAPTAVVEQPTATVAPTEPPTEVPPTSTPEPTATPAPEPQPITAANISGLAMAGVVEIPRQPSLALDPNRAGIVGAFTSDSQYIVLRADSGVDVISAQDLEPVATYPGLWLMNVLPDGRFAALQNGRVVLVNPQSGETETLATQLDSGSLLAVDPQGAQAAQLIDSQTVRIFDLISNSTSDISLNANELPTQVSFTPDAQKLAVAYDGSLAVFDLASAQRIYETAYNPTYNFSPDGKYLTTGTFPRQLLDATTGDTISTFGDTIQIQRGVVGPVVTGAIVEERIDLTGYFMVGGPETVIAFWTHSITRIDNPNGQWNTDLYTKPEETYESYIEDFIKGVRKFGFSGFGVNELAIGFGAPDGSVFLLINTSGNLALHSLKDGGRLALSERYTVGGPSRLSPDGIQVGWSNLEGVYTYDWQNAKSVLEQSQPLKLSYANLIGFLPEGRLLVESVPSGGVGLDVWNIASGSIDTTLPALSDCEADAVGAYVLCTVPSTGARRILAVSNPDRIVFNTNDPNITVISPTGDSYATCNPGGGSITYKNYESGNVTIAQPCQTMFYSPDGKMLVLQSGVVMNLPTGDSTLTLEADASGKAFSSDSPAAFFGSDFIVINNRAFDLSSGELLAELPMSGALGYLLSADSMTLNVLTGSGMEQWQVVQ